MFYSIGASAISWLGELMLYTHEGTTSRETSDWSTVLSRDQGEFSSWVELRNRKAGKVATENQGPHPAFSLAKHVGLVTIAGQGSRKLYPQ